MQIFVLHYLPKLGVTEFYDCHVPKLAMEAAQLLISKAIEQRKPWVNEMVPGPDGHKLSPWSSLSKGHLKHPCYLWTLADEHHAWWLLNHALAICHEYTIRSRKSESDPGKKTIIQYHLEHIRRNTPPPKQERSAYSVDDFECFLTHVYPTEPDRVKELMQKVCTVNPPHGCNFGILAADVQHLVVTKNGKDLVASYRKYYDTKKDTFRQPIRHCKRKREEYYFQK